MSSGILTARKRKSTTTEVKILILGAANVGKSALTVRFVTKRYIGDYHHETECSPYRFETTLDSEPVLVELCDLSSKPVSELLCGSWVSGTDALLLVYSVTDRHSFCFLKQLHHQLQQLSSPSWPSLLVANKADLSHLRQVGSEEGEILARDMECISFCEVSAAEQISEVCDLFSDLCREVISARRKAKQSLFDRVLRNRSSLRTYARGKSDSALP